MDDKQNGSSNSTKKRMPSASDLARKQEKLEAQLKAVREEIRMKEAARRAVEKQKAKNDRTRALILAGSLLSALISEKQIPSDGIKQAAEAYYAAQIKRAEGQPQKPGEGQDDHEARVKRQADKLRRDRSILIDYLEAL